jgi:hypothetical protein
MLRLEIQAKRLSSAVRESIPTGRWFEELGFQLQASGFKSFATKTPKPEARSPKPG